MITLLGTMITLLGIMITLLRQSACLLLTLQYVFDTLVVDE